MDGKVMPLAGHLRDLRKTLIVSGLAIIISAVAIFAAFGDALFNLITTPVKALDVPVISIRVTEILMAKIKLSLLAGLAISFPLIIWQIWGFISPALNKRERIMAYILTPVSVLLFALGLTFAFLVVFPMAVKFLLLTMTGELSPMITIKEYVAFSLAFFIPFGLAFQLPVVVYVLGRLRLISPTLLKNKRKYALLIIVTAAAILTPGPDVVSQLLLAGPVYLLYEISILISYLVCRRQKSPHVGTVGI